MKKKSILFVMMFMLSISFVITSANAAPGIMQTATRAGFFTNQLPDDPFMLIHVYDYTADEYADENGDTTDLANDLNVGLGLFRFIKAWHFGDSNQFQYVLEGVFGYENVNLEDADYSASGSFDPTLYTQIGWNNADKTTNLQFYVIVQSPWGSNDVHSAFGYGEDAWKVMPGVAFEQQFGPFWIDGSIGYFHYFDDLSVRDAHGRDYFEVNIIPSFHPTATLGIYVQADYKKTSESRYHGVDQNDDGYNIAIAPGIGWFFRPNMQLDLKYVMDVDGENEYQGAGFNLRYFWLF